MFYRATISCLMYLTACLPGYAQEQTFELKAEAAKAQLFEQSGPYQRTVSTKSEEAQKYFDQGLTWLYAFNHDDAVHCFSRAAELDDGCAMAWWGISLCYGPQYNHPPTAENAAKALEALEQAIKRIENTTPVERRLIEALKLRNTKGEFDEDEQSKCNTAYAKAMTKIWNDFPNDPDVGTLCAEAMMTVRPWKLYTEAGEPEEDTPAILSALERVIAIQPDHPGALHYYIHAMEPSHDPGKALFAAERLGDLVPSSGHLLHMPCHIYVQTGLWNRAIEQSEKAMKADDEYRERIADPGVQHGYMIHNSHMLAFAAMMSGREEDAMVAARDMWQGITEEVIAKHSGDFDHNMCAVFDVYKRFGRWQKILDEKAPPKSLPVTQATWRAARAVAHANLGDFDAASFEYGRFREAYHNVDEERYWGSVTAKRVLEVSDHFVVGEIALRKGILADSKGQRAEAEEFFAQAERSLIKAVEVEDVLGYGEPPQWLQPVRHTLGGVYLRQGKFADAERVYREDLDKWQDNVWSLEGLRQALEKQEKQTEADEVAAKLSKLELISNFKPTESCKCLASPANQ